MDHVALAEVAALLFAAMTFGCPLLLMFVSRVQQ